MHLGLSAKATTFGLGRHADDLTSESFLLSVKWVLIAAPSGIIGVALPKLAVVIFLARVVGPTRRNQIRTLYFFAITLNILTARSHVHFYPMFPTVRSLDAQRPAYLLESCSYQALLLFRCWYVSSLRIYIEPFSHTSAAYSAFNDLVLGIFPVSVIFKLQMSRKTQFGISFLMGLGLL